MKYHENLVDKLYQENLAAARTLLASLPVAEGREPISTGVSGWVYEQTIRYCLRQELMALGMSLEMKEQVPLYKRKKIDLLVGKVAVEMKARGFFNSEAGPKYNECRINAERKGWVYCYLTRSESYPPYRVAAKYAFGPNRAFFMDTPKDWERFVKEVRENCGENL